MNVQHDDGIVIGTWFRLFEFARDYREGYWPPTHTVLAEGLFRCLSILGTQRLPDHHYFPPAINHALEEAQNQANKLMAAIEFGGPFDAPSNGFCSALRRLGEIYATVPEEEWA
jgi:hypothetical protein